MGTRQWRERDECQRLDILSGRVVGFSIELPDGTIENGAQRGEIDMTRIKALYEEAAAGGNKYSDSNFVVFHPTCVPHSTPARSAMDGPSWLQWRTPKKQKTAPGPHGTPKTKEKKNRDTARRRHNRKVAKQHKAAAALAPGQQTLDQLAAKAQHVTMVNASCTMAFA